MNSSLGEIPLLKKVKENTNLIKEEEAKDEGVIMTTYKDTIDTVWYLDSGASNHMTASKHLFVEMKEVKKAHVKFGGVSNIPVKGRGKIYFFLNGKEGVIEDVLEDVLYVPDLTHNLLCMGQLMEKGYSVCMKDRIMHLKDKGGQLIARVKMARNRTYTINLKTQQRLTSESKSEPSKGIKKEKICPSDRKVGDNKTSDCNLTCEPKTETGRKIKEGEKVVKSDDFTRDTVWYLDTGASCHASGNKHLFVEMDETDNDHVQIQFGDASKIQVKGHGKIYFSLNGKKGVIEDVYYVPYLKHNVLSMGQLMKNGYSVRMKDKIMHLKDKGGQLNARVKMAKNHRYTINLMTQQQLTSESISEPNMGLKEDEICRSDRKASDKNTSGYDLTCEPKTEIEEEKEKEGEKVVISHDFTKLKIELENLREEIKMVEAALQGASRQAQAKAECDELCKRLAAQEVTIQQTPAQIREFEEEKQRLNSKLQVEEANVESIKRDQAADIFTKALSTERFN